MLFAAGIVISFFAGAAFFFHYNVRPSSMAVTLVLGALVHILVVAALAILGMLFNDGKR